MESKPQKKGKKKKQEKKRKHIKHIAKKDQEEEDPILNPLKFKWNQTSKRGFSKQLQALSQKYNLSCFIPPPFGNYFFLPRKCFPFLIQHLSCKELSEFLLFPLNCNGDQNLNLHMHKDKLFQWFKTWNSFLMLGYGHPREGSASQLQNALKLLKDTRVWKCWNGKKYLTSLSGYILHQWNFFVRTHVVQTTEFQKEIIYLVTLIPLEPWALCFEIVTGKNCAGFFRALIMSILQVFTDLPLSLIEICLTF